MTETGNPLRRCGLRHTARRELIVGILRETRTHLSVTDLHRRLAAERPTLSASTIYRNVVILSGHGLLHHFDHDGETRFGLAHTPHDHLVCDRCGRIAELPAGRVGQALKSLILPDGFALTASAQLLHGLCGLCGDPG
ncbi:Fur family transcriptional regulator [Sphaerisporangium corydalis]|uniref:Fur family transcriptional regulator n=1 Tax=Sphaerisporangium corydalis TaxID=1441875 RepID=A0ABV9EKB0_9ACTN|nr:Fur family transcriptional regulator [Sphaerisporangium corydalis]